ncbi:MULTISPECIES: Sir2 family NAD-dependent protein deacetylase [Kribbella]|uniref:SIR2 family NAD-dependent protein deacylase n=1 Tax=Kribbella TaxID=182639 RepID=UPI001F541990|nr:MULTISPECIES: Sir2 family NAD-dependent protein deacetylase [Kribbella]
MTLELVAKAERIAVLTGAGISTASGIPDFRGPQGVWTKNPAAQVMFDIDEYVASAAVRIEAWKFRLAAPTWTAEPNGGHRALVDLERQGRLTGLITQNIDGLHQKAGSSPALVHELHGTIWYVDCLNCARRIPMADVFPRLEAGDEDPACEVCGGILKSATVSFGHPRPGGPGRSSRRHRASRPFHRHRHVSAGLPGRRPLRRRLVSRRRPPHPECRANPVRRPGNRRPHHPDRTMPPRPRHVVRLIIRTAVT